MNLYIYNYIADKLTEAIDKGYRKGIASVVLLNKKEILRLADTPELFKISYTDVDRVALTNFKVEAFTVAGVMSYECEEKLKQLAVELQEGNHPLAKGEKDIKKIWADEAYNILADYVQMPDMPPPNYLNTNLRTAMQSSYHAAQYIRLQDESVRDLYPAYQYKTLADARVREAHMKLHDMIWASNDPVWDKIWPPNGWNCRCYIKPLNQEEKANSNVQPITLPEKVSDIAREGRIGKDFERNPGQTRSIWDKWKDSKLKQLNLYSKFKEVFDYSKSINRFEQTGLVEYVLDKNLTQFRDLELTDENWQKEFPDNKVQTPVGEGILQGTKNYESQFEKVGEKRDGRSRYFGCMKPTLEDPAMIIKDDKGGILFVRSFMKKDNKIIMFGVGFEKGELVQIISLGRRELRNLISKIKNGEVLHFSASAMNTFTEIPWKHFTIGSDLLNLNTNLATFSVTNKSKTDSNEVIDNPNEVWGETYNYNGVINSELHYIRYRFEGFEVVKVNNSTPYNYTLADYSKIDEYRKGVLIKEALQLNSGVSEA